MLPRPFIDTFQLKRPSVEMVATILMNQFNSREPCVSSGKFNHHNTHCSLTDKFSNWRFNLVLWLRRSVQIPPVYITSQTNSVPLGKHAIKRGSPATHFPRSQQNREQLKFVLKWKTGQTGSQINSISEFHHKCCCAMEQMAACFGV